MDGVVSKNTNELKTPRAGGVPESAHATDKTSVPRCFRHQVLVAAT